MTEDNQTLGASDPGNDAAALIREAIGHHRAGHLEDAVAGYEAALMHQPASADLRRAAAAALSALGRAEDALAHLRQAAGQEPDDLDTVQDLGMALAETGRWDEAERLGREILARHPGSVQTYRWLGVVLVNAGRVDAASEVLMAPVRLMRHPDRRETDGLPTFNETSPAKLAHDLAQLEHLQQTGVALPDADTVQRDLRGLIEAVAARGITEVQTLTEGQSPEFRRFYNRLVRHPPAPQLPGGVINPALDRAAVEAEFLNAAGGLVQVDELLSPDALAALQRFCADATIWFQMDYAHQVGTSLKNGFASPLVLQIAAEMRTAFPRIFGPHLFTTCWAYKYLGDVSGLDVHADDAQVSVNFWITPDAANLDPASGGLTFWETPAPARYFAQATAEKAATAADLTARTGNKTRRVPYGCNRAAIFRSDLFHRTEKIQFAEGYTQRRLNMTFLYGRR